ncbi:MAG: hypothetical protein ABFD18_17700 [Syntrophomonas sp.]
MRTMILILIGVVFVTTLVFAVLVWKQTIKIEKSALASKKLKEKQMRKLELEQEMESEIQKMSKERQAYESASECQNNDSEEENPS